MYGLPPPKVCLIILNKPTKARHKGFTLMEILVACAIIIALSVGAFFAYQEASESRKLAMVNSDLDAIASACLAYESLSIYSMPPTDLIQLISGLDSTMSVDGCEHLFIGKPGCFEPGDSYGYFPDPWNNEYDYSQKLRAIGCTLPDGRRIIRYF